MCKLPKPPASRALCQAKRAPRAAFPSGCLAAQTKRWEKAREFQKNIYFCFIDYAKAFDCMDHNKLWEILKEMGIPDHLTCLLRPGFDPWVRTIPGEGNGSPLQYSCLKNHGQRSLVQPLDQHLSANISATLNSLISALLAA